MPKNVPGLNITKWREFRYLRCSNVQFRTETFVGGRAIFHGSTGLHFELSPRIEGLSFCFEDFYDPRKHHGGYDEDKMYDYFKA
jgi:hypothetical protein